MSSEAESNRLTHRVEPELSSPAPRAYCYNKQCGLAMSPWQAQCLLIVVAVLAVANINVLTGDDRTLGIIGFVILVFTSQIIIWKDPLLERKLVRTGVPVAGKITSRYTSRGLRGGQSYWLKYEFKTNGGEHIEDNRVVNSTRYNSVHDGETVTVLYDRHHPRLNVIYKLAAYKART